jgi:hypothetical protein
VEINAKLHYGSVVMQGMQCHMRKCFNGEFQLLIISEKHDIRLPLLCHVVGIPQGGKLSGQGLRSSISGKVALSGIFQDTNLINMINQI